MVFRASLNADEVSVLKGGKLLQASLEVYAPLRDEDPKKGDTLVNLAQSLSEVRYYAAP